MINKSNLVLSFLILLFSFIVYILFFYTKKTQSEFGPQPISQDETFLNSYLMFSEKRMKADEKLLSFDTNDIDSLISIQRIDVKKGIRNDMINVTTSIMDIGMHADTLKKHTKDFENEVFQDSAFSNHSLIMSNRVLEQNDSAFLKLIALKGVELAKPASITGFGLGSYRKVVSLDQGKLLKSFKDYGIEDDIAKKAAPGIIKVLRNSAVKRFTVFVTAFGIALTFEELFLPRLTIIHRIIIAFAFGVALMSTFIIMQKKGIFKK